MKNVIKFFVCCTLLFAVSTVNAQERTGKINKKINKAIGKLWEGKVINESKVPTDVAYELELFFDESKLSRLTADGSSVGYMLLRRGYGCKIGGCGTGSYADGGTCAADGGTYETFDYVVFFDESLTLLKMMVVDYPGDYGYEICSKNWLKQFVGYQGKPLTYKADIDGISGATISAKSITSDIQSVHKYLTQLVFNSSEQLLTGSTNK